MIDFITLVAWIIYTCFYYIILLLLYLLFPNDNFVVFDRQIA